MASALPRAAELLELEAIEIDQRRERHRKPPRDYQGGDRGSLAATLRRVSRQLRS